MLSRLFERVGSARAVRVVGFMFLALCGVSCVLVRSRVQPTPRPLAVRDYLQCVRGPVVLATMLGGFLFFWGMFLPLNYIIIQAQTSGISSDLI